MKTILDKETRRAMRDSVVEYGVEGLITPEAFVVLLDYVDTLEAALRNCMGMLEELDGLDWGEEGMPFTVDWDDLNRILTRAKSPAPVGITGSAVGLAKHSGSVVGLTPVTPQHYFTAPATPAKHCEDCAPEFGCFDGSEPCCKRPLVRPTPAKHPDTELLTEAADSVHASLAEDGISDSRKAYRAGLEQRLRLAARKHPDTVLTPAQFLEAVAKLGEENGYSLGHEDRHGAFLVEDFNPSYKEWLLSALDQTCKRGGAR